jgi:hypothetical protein
MRELATTPGRASAGHNHGGPWVGKCTAGARAGCGAGKNGQAARTFVIIDASRAIVWTTADHGSMIDNW